MASIDPRSGDPCSPALADPSPARIVILLEDADQPGSRVRPENPEDRLVEARELEVVVLRAELEVGGPRANGLADAALRRGEL